MEIFWSDSGLLPDPDDLTVGSEERTRNRDLARRITKPIMSMQIVGAFFHYLLKKDKLQMFRPKASEIFVYLSRCPEVDIKVNRGALFVEIQEDPLVLLGLPNHSAIMGEFALSCWEKAIPKLIDETDFPAEIFREYMEKFRSQNYSLRNTLKRQRILGSTAWARIHGTVSCARTIVSIEVTNRGQHLFEKVIWDVPEQLFNVAYTQRDILVEGQALKVGAAGLNFAPEVLFPLDSLPSEFLKTLT